MIRNRKSFKINSFICLISIGVVFNIVSQDTVTSQLNLSPEIYILRRVKQNTAVNKMLCREAMAIDAFLQNGDIDTLTAEEAKELAEREGQGIKTEFGSYVFRSKVRSRSAGNTVIVGSEKVRDEELGSVQEQILKQLPETLNLVHQYLAEHSFNHTQGFLGSNSKFTPECNLFVSAEYPEYSRINHMVAQSLFQEGIGEEQPDYTIIFIPEWAEVAAEYAQEIGIELQDIQIIRFPEIGITYVLGSDYFGEAKKGFLTQMNWDVKNTQGRLALHAGTRIDSVRDAESGEIKKVTSIFLGLSGTGKTTLSVHPYGLNSDDGERSFIVQDDFIAMLTNAAEDSDRSLIIGWEDGFYLKTDGIDAIGSGAQPLILAAATTDRAIFENVSVTPQGEVDFNKPGP